MTPATEFEIMRTLHTLWLEKLITFEEVESLLIKSTQLELTFMDEKTIKSESLDGKTKYKIS
jgi:hypothetical protein